MATHSRILAWRILWTEGPGRALGPHRVGHDSVTEQQQPARRGRVPTPAWQLYPKLVWALWEPGEPLLTG